MNKIAIIQLRQLGDIILTTPIFRAIKENDPSCHLSFISHRMGKLIVKGNPYIDEHIVFDEKQKFIEKYSVIEKLRSQDFDMAIDFMNNPRSALLTFLINAKDSCSYRSNRSIFYKRVHNKASTSMYIVDEKLSLLQQSLQMVSHNRDLILPYFESDSAAIKNFFSTLPTDKPRVVLSPTHRRPQRQWEQVKFCKLAEDLKKNFNAEIFWLWGPGEKDFCLEHQQKCGVKTHMAPPTSFAEMACFIANCDFFIGTSNGPSHAAVSCHTPSIQLHGHTHLTSWCPMNELHTGIQSKEFKTIKNPTLSSIELDHVNKLFESKHDMLKKSLKARLDQKDRIWSNWGQLSVKKASLLQ